MIFPMVQLTAHRDVGWFDRLHEFHLPEGTVVVDWHHLDELRQIEIPVLQNSPSPCGVGVMDVPSR